MLTMPPASRRVVLGYTMRITLLAFTRGRIPSTGSLMGCASYGQWRRYEVATTGVHDAQIVIHLDAPVGGLYAAAGRVPCALTRLTRLESLQLAGNPDLECACGLQRRRGDATFPCNESYFRPGNVETGAEGVAFALREESHGDRRFTSGSLSTGEDGDFLFGRFEVTLKASPASGVVSASCARRAARKCA